MLTFFQSIILGLLQGMTELFPVSSLGHSVIIPSLLGWNIDQKDNYFLVFIVATHLATSLVLFGFFFKDWMRIIGGMFTSLKNRRIDPTQTYEKLGWLLVVTTIPAGILGLLFEEKLKTLFASPLYVSIFLILNGFLLLAAEKLGRKNNDGKNLEMNGHIRNDSSIESIENPDVAPARLSWSQGLKVGCAQALALLPGFSRTGATLGGGLLVGLSHRDAARFSFLLATPIIFAAAALKLPDLVGSQTYPLGSLLAGVIASALGAYVSVKFLTNYFETKTLTPFGAYCIAAGVLSWIILVIR